MNNKKKSSKNNIKLIHWDIEKEPIEFPKKIRAIYEKCYKLNRVKFTKWIDKFNKKNRENIDWWMTLPSTRDPYKSQLFNYFCVIDTLTKINLNNIRISTKSKKKYEFLTSHLKKLTSKIEIKNTNKFKLVNIFSNFIKSMLFQLIIYTYINIFIKKKKINNKENIIIDIFITNNEKQNSNFYSPFKYNKKEMLFVPTFIPTFNYFKLFKIINNLSKKNNFLFKEHYIKISDLFFSFFHIFRRNEFLKIKYFYKKFDFSKVVHDEIKNFKDFDSIFVGLLNFKFFYRLKEGKIKIRKTINWFENQIIDKGWNLGCRKFFKDEANSFGIQDFGKHYNMINSSPSFEESKARVIPEKIEVISKIYVNTTKEFYSKQKVFLGTTWRFRNIRKKNIRSTKKRKEILLVLCGIYKIDRILINLIYKTCSENKRLIINIKAHPILNIEQVIKRKLPRNMVIKEESLQRLLDRTKTIITSGPSSTIFESSSNGCRLILPNIEAGTKVNAIRHKLPGTSFRIINNNEELLRSLKIFNNL